MAADIKGVTEETTTGVKRLYKMHEKGELLFPAINVNDSVTKSQVRQPLRLPPLAGRRHLPRHRRDDRRQDRRRRRLRRRRQGLRPGARGQGARVIVTEIDPINALQAAMEGYQVTDDRRRRRRPPTSSCRPPATTTSSPSSTWPKMKHNAIVCNIGHFDSEIDMAGLARCGATRDELKPGTDLWTFADGHAVIVLAEGRLVNLGCATGHPSFVMSCSFSNQVIAQIELFNNTEQLSRSACTCCPKRLDEKVAALHLDALGVKLTKLTDEQAEYLGVDPSGPFKPEHYRY